MLSRRFYLFLSLGIFCVLLSSIKAGCVLGGSSCKTGSPGCLPKILNRSDPDAIKPKKYTYSPENRGLCPDFENIANCCDNNVMTSMRTNFNLLDQTFGAPSAGCPICSTNLKRFWCTNNCAPNQDQFLDPDSVKITEAQGRKVVKFDTVLDIETTCKIFSSCKSVDFAKSLGSMATYQALFNSFSSEAVTQGNTLQLFTYETSPKAMASKVINCSDPQSGPKDKFNYSLPQGQGWCTCQHCSSNCTKPNFAQYIKQRDLMEGFDMNIFWGAAVAAWVLLVFGIFLHKAREYRAPLAKNTPPSEPVEENQPLAE